MYNSIIELSDDQIARLASLAVSPEWLTFTAVCIGGVEFAGNLIGAYDGKVVFVRAGEISEPSGD
jgi:hypothetical protein